MSERCQTLSEEQVILKGSRDGNRRLQCPNSRPRPPEGAGLVLRANGRPGLASARERTSGRRCRGPLVQVSQPLESQDGGGAVSASSLSPVLKLMSLIVWPFLWGHHYNELNLLWNLLGRQAQGKLLINFGFVSLSSSFNPVFIPFNEIPHANNNQTENLMNINEI